jgi:FkbM family methyltransferase
MSGMIVSANKMKSAFLKAGALLTGRGRADSANHSFSQCGEDLVVEYALVNYLKIKNPAYLDIGAHHPVFLSNTYLFYTKGCSGVCVEPDPDLFCALKEKRKRDICLNACVGPEAKDRVDFYLMTSRSLNTMSKQEAVRYQGYGTQKIEQVVQLPMLSVNDICRTYFHPCPHYVSLDVEGAEMDILSGFDFSLFRPEIMCIETLTYTEDRTERKINEIIELMKSNGYFVYADTYINTIFIDTLAWKRRRQ